MFQNQSEFLRGISQGYDPGQENINLCYLALDKKDHSRRSEINKMYFSFPQIPLTCLSDTSVNVFSFFLRDYDEKKIETNFLNADGERQKAWKLWDGG